MDTTRRRYAKHRIPTYRRQIRDDGSDLAFVEIDGRRHYLGIHNSQESRERYHRMIAEWEASGRAAQSAPSSENLSVAELANQFLKWAGAYYVKHGHPTSEPSNIALAIRPLRKLCARMRAADFGPRTLKGVRQEMIRLGWCRKHINRNVDRIKRMFKWGVAEELIPPGVYEGLRAVPGLRYGRSDAPDNQPVAPAPLELVDAVKPLVGRQVRAMIELQLLTGARPGEIAIIRPCDIDRSDSTWVYRPAEHKTEHHGYMRMVFIGPQGQEVLAPFLLRDPQAYCFSPVEAEADRLRWRHEERTTPLSCGNVPGSNRKDRCDRKTNDHYTNSSYRRAIDRAIVKAFPPPEPLAKRADETDQQWRARLTGDQKQAVKRWEKEHHWHPHQLRHNYATMVRKEDNLESAQILLGHSKADVTQIYAERDIERAKRVALKVG